MTFNRRTFDVVSVYGLKFSYQSIEAVLAEVLEVDEPLVQLILTDSPKGMAITVEVCRDHIYDEKRIRDALYEVFELDEMLDMGYLTLSVRSVERACFAGRKLRRVIDKRSAAPFG